MFLCFILLKNKIVILIHAESAKTKRNLKSIGAEANFRITAQSY